MKRLSLEHLLLWKNSPRRKPMIIRGARQVGKSYLVRDFAEQYFENIIEINFERSPEMEKLFSCNDPKRIIQTLELEYETSIGPGSSLLFLDEIQAAPAVIASLRYFYEDYPEQHVVAAGSLLEFALDHPNFSVPVGRIEYYYLGPMTFEEFLEASGHERQLSYLKEFSIDDDISESLHHKLMEQVRFFMLTGGMPASIQAYLDGGGFIHSEKEKLSILETYREDIGKYKGKTDGSRIRKVFDHLPAMTGEKFKPSKIDREDSARNLSNALDLLCQSRVAHRVFHSDGNGIPLGNEIKASLYKTVFLDVGLQLTSQGLDLSEILKTEDICLINKGSVAEQYVGQHLLYKNVHLKPELHYWVREKVSSNAEVDYLVAKGQQIVPIEVKSGKTGTLKSLQVFLWEKNRSLGIRINGDLPSFHQAKFSIPNTKGTYYHLLSIPFYLIGQLDRLLGASIENRK